MSSVKSHGGKRRSFRKSRKNNRKSRRNRKQSGGDASTYVAQVAGPIGGQVSQAGSNAGPIELKPVIGGGVADNAALVTVSTPATVTTVPVVKGGAFTPIPTTVKKGGKKSSKKGGDLTSVLVPASLVLLNDTVGKRGTRSNKLLNKATSRVRGLIPL